MTSNHTQIQQFISLGKQTIAEPNNRKALDKYTALGESILRGGKR